MILVGSVLFILLAMVPYLLIRVLIWLVARLS
jgi:hypothetical protein